jgi:LCP family protein required for cell wall assembly
MSKDPEEPGYRVYRAEGSTHAAKRKRPAADRGGGPADFEYGGTGGEPAEDEAPDYRVYRSQPRGLGSRLRGETESDVGRRAEEAQRRDGGSGGRGRDGRGGAGSLAGTAPRRRGLSRWGRGTWTVRRAIAYVVLVLLGWVLLSAVLFLISAQTKAGNLPKGLSAALSQDSAPMLVSAQNVLVLGLDNRPTTGYSSKEGGLTAGDRLESDARTDSIMLWRIGGGVSRRLSIPRDTLVDLPGVGEEKINAAWNLVSPAETVKIVESLTGVKINHVIVVDLANFPKFIDDIGGVTVRTPKICSKISGGAAQGGYTLNLKAGAHHLTGDQALTLARTRDNSCNAAYSDIQREEMQQEILNGIKSQLFSVHAFLHLPWASWDAPGVIQTDMGGPTLLSLFASSEIGGSSKPETLTETGEDYDGADVLVSNPANVRAKVNQLLTGR